jgi:C-terminal processing protease CtpA/Prc
MLLCLQISGVMCLLQVSTVGVTESKFSTGVVIPQVFEGAVGQMAGIQEGDTIMKLNGRFMKPSMTAVNDLVNYIKCALLQPFLCCRACSHRVLGATQAC